MEKKCGFPFIGKLLLLLQKNYLSMNQPLAPTTEKQRHLILDALRGFALLGICIANFPEFSLWSFMSSEAQQALDTSGTDTAVRFLQYLLVDAKFYSIFSILFGIGFSIILSHASERGANGMRVFYRRMVILLVIAIGHLMLIWSGDILVLYAIAGMLLPLVRHWSNRNLLILSATLILLPVGIDLWQECSGINLAAPIMAAWWTKAHSYGITEENFAAWLRDIDGYRGMHEFLMQGAIERLWEFVDGHRLLKVLGLFTLGYCIGRNRIYARLAELRHQIKKTLFYGLAIGVPTSLLYAISATQEHPWGLTAHSFLYAVSATPLALAYMSGICLICLRRPHDFLLTALSKPGRLALSCYIGQSVAGVMIYYGIGLGLGTSMCLGEVVLVAIGVFAAETVIAWIWLRYMRYGPLEWIWRMLTYGRWLPLLRK